MIALDGVSARVGNFTLNDISFTVARGAYGVVIGPAGAGKTTLLETIAGLVPVTAGTVTLRGVETTHTPPESRGVGIVYQHAYLFPHLSVAENIAYGTGNRAAIEEMTERFALAPLLDRTVQALSGGERQLVALARALAPSPDILLLDEPFAALDPRTRIVMRRQLAALYAERAMTVLHVTHDLAEAARLGNPMVLLEGGRVLQAGPPDDLFNHPASAAVADFLLPS